tara:strand:+ start:2923 stop:3789 length:867 start_codon:yes stop_codon:yes gene_type:complete
MKRIIILVPVFNDWESLKRLLQEINKNIKNFKNIVVDCFIVNDASTIKQPKMEKPDLINLIKIFNMKKNQGHARCNAFGIKYIFEQEEFDNLIVMDGDGEDRPQEIKDLINQSIKDPNKSIVAKRIKRSEGLFFQLLYKFHKLLTLFFTGQNINFGNFTCLTKADVGVLSTRGSLWNSFSGTLKKNIKYFNEINSIRGSRYYGPSKMRFSQLILHSLSIISVFKYQVFFRSLLIFFLLSLLNNFIGALSLILQFLLIIFNFIIFVISLREKKIDLINSQNNLRDIKEI